MVETKNFSLVLNNAIGFVKIEADFLLFNRKKALYGKTDFAGSYFQTAKIL